MDMVWNGESTEFLIIRREVNLTALLLTPVNRADHMPLKKI
jgi:hypothetical protein